MNKYILLNFKNLLPGNLWTALLPPDTRGSGRYIIGGTSHYLNVSWIELTSMYFPNSDTGNYQVANNYCTSKHFLNYACM